MRNTNHLKYKELIYKLAYESKLNTKKEISRELGLNEGTVLRYVKKYNDHALNERFEKNRHHTASLKSTEQNIKTWKDEEIAGKRKNSAQKTKLKGKNPEDIFRNEIRPLLYEGKSACMISKISDIGLSGPTIRKYVKKFGSEQDIIKLKKNASEGKAIASKRKKGQPSPFKGKTYEEILGSKEKARKRAKQTSDWMKQNNWNPRKFCTKISKPQRILFEIIKEKYSDAELEFEYKREDGYSMFLDIAIPSVRINIEYDGYYWHKINNEKNINRSVLTDEQRDEILLKNDWKVYRFQYKRTPSREVLVAKAKEYGII